MTDVPDGDSNRTVVLTRETSYIAGIAQFIDASQSIAGLTPDAIGNNTDLLFFIANNGGLLAKAVQTSMQQRIADSAVQLDQLTATSTMVRSAL